MDLSWATCAADRDPGEVTWATVRSSEREFEHERFTVWRCPACRCIHAYEDVDLDRCYERYSLHATELDLLETPAPTPTRACSGAATGWSCPPT